MNIYMFNGMIFLDWVVMRVDSIIDGSSVTINDGFSGTIGCALRFLRQDGFLLVCMTEMPDFQKLD